MADKPVANLGRKMYTPLPGILTAPQELTTDSYVNLTGMVVALQANYLYEVYVLIRAVGDIGTVKWSPPSGATMEWNSRAGFILSSDGFVGGIGAGDMLDVTGEPVFSTSGPSPINNEYLGSIETDAAGNLQLQAKLDAPGSGTISRSYVRAQPIGPLT